MGCIEARSSHEPTDLLEKKAIVRPGLRGKVQLHSARVGYSCDPAVDTSRGQPGCLRHAKSSKMRHCKFFKMHQLRSCADLCRELFDQASAYTTSHSKNPNVEARHGRSHRIYCPNNGTLPGYRRDGLDLWRSTTGFHARKALRGQGRLRSPWTQDMPVAKNSQRFEKNTLELLESKAELSVVVRRQTSV